MKTNSRFGFCISLCLALFGLLACAPNDAARPSSASGVSLDADGAVTVDQTATAASAVIATALAGTQTPNPTVGVALVDTNATKTVEAQGSATAAAEATRLAQPTATPTPDIGATETKAAQSMATSVSATLTAQPTPSPSHTPTPNLTATAVVIEGGIATSVAATLAAQPTATPPPQPTPTTLIRPPDDNPGTLRIAFVYGDVGDSDLRVADVETGSERIIAGQACDEAEPAWSPSGAQLVYHADCAESYDIYRVNSDGSASTRLTFTGDIDEREPAYSPDGSQIIYRVNPREATETNAVGELWVMDVNGNSQHALGFIGRAPAWSPDGSRIAFMSDRSGRWNIYLYEVGTGRADQLTSCDTNCRWPAWSSDGQAIVYNTTTKPTNTEAEAIWIISARGGNATRIAVGRNPGRASWSGTGLIAFNSTDGIEYMREDGSARALLLPGDVNWAPHWSK